MNARFWICILFLVVGAGLAGYSSGHYEGVRATRIETQEFLQDFARSTDLEAYLRQHGQAGMERKAASLRHRRSDFIRSFL